MQLNVPLYRQEETSEDCGIVCVQMLIDFHGEKKSFTKLKESIEVRKEGTYAPQLGAYFLQNGFAVEIITLHPGLFTLRDIVASQEKIAERIRNLQKTATSEFNIKALQYFDQYLKLGGRITPKIPDANDIQNSIDKHEPLIALLTAHFLTESEPKFGFHFNVVTGISGDTLFRNDPLHDSRGGKKSSSVNDFFYGMFASIYGGLDNGSLLRISKQ